MAIVSRALGAFGAAGALLLGSCSGDDLPKRQAFCSSFGTSAQFAWSTCTNCTVTNPALAYDGDLDTTAAITPNANQTTDGATLSAQSVADIAGGATVGVWVTEPASAQRVKNIRTLKDGQQQEIVDANNVVVEYADEGTAAAGFFGMETTLDFDTVEFTVTNTFASGQTPVYYVYEICSDGGAS